MFIGGSIEDRLAAYALSRGLRPGRRLGFGKDGSVWATDRPSAVKVFDQSWTFGQECAVYARLAAHAVTAVRGHRVPQVLATDETLGVIEMSIVKPPFLLDFAGARLDDPVEFPEDIIEQWLADKREEFGSHWPRVAGILHELERMGISMLDVHPGNIRFGAE
jgi:hypothetical protein